MQRLGLSVRLERRLKRRVAHGLRWIAGPGGRPTVNGTPSTFGALVALAWPIATAMAGETLLGLVDTKLVGGLGPSALGGVGIATMLMFLHYSVVYGGMRGVKVGTAHAVGRGVPQDGARYAWSGVAIGAIFGIAVWCVTRDVSPLLRFIGVDEGLVRYGADFFGAVTYGAPAACALASLVNHRQAIGDARTPMAIGIAGNVVNAAVSYALIYGKFGLPALGVRGGGYGTALTEWLELSVLLVVLTRETRRAPVRSTMPFKTAAREVLSLGVPTGLHFACEGLAMTTFTAILGSLAVSEMAAHQIALVTIRTSFLPGVAVAEASCVLVGQALGRRDLAEADRANRAALALASTFMTACGIAFAVFGVQIARAFTDDPEVAHIVRRLLLVAAVFQVLDAVNIVLRGSLRGAKDVRATAIIGIIVVWTCVPGAAFLLGKVAGLGALGGWLGFLGETIFASVLFWHRWKRGAWRRGFADPVVGTEIEASAAGVASVRLAECG